MKTATKPTLTAIIDAVNTEIAAAYLDVATLERRGSDELDFHNVGVANLRDAMAAAYRAGMEHARRTVAAPNAPLPGTDGGDWVVTGRAPGGMAKPLKVNK